ncbi:Eco57I restriction-modification methylase domain-containing protein [Finegoldia magna]|uniref:Eco57I restriction-modification methylase domain-containing protein n=1 Tax=Finegoldia magna TaxID=1260 RepID=UPI002913DB3C|nr:Eco57I restriction-modification methylase domain-containing protein [Finegoldia magna]MDU5201398.1 Eco57I restriction-modification methylase domain-containing protein [Finegoldia magna]MDU6776340.1 Eco57I restriction-modification methylase domain-containing protein [Finegoldia magna]
MKKFDFVIGNPPYQEDKETRNRSDALYDIFMEKSYEISDKVMLITLARFLFNIGSTSTKWNNKMLNDEHFKVMKYIQKSNMAFPGTDIKGGVAITYRDATKNFGEIGTFTPFEELNSILKKVVAKEGKDRLGIGHLMYVQNKLNLDKLKKYNEDIIKKLGSGGKERRLVSSIFDTLSELFLDNIEDSSKQDYYRIIGRQGNKRIFKWIKKDFIEDNGNLYAYKVIVPAANGSGTIGEVLSTPLIGEPLIGYTQTFISIGCFETYEEANNLLKYIKCKFTRAMLGIKKVTQNNKTKETWSKIPVQDFTENSDIDWSQSIPEIDQQLYEKYNLSKDEIDFIEEKVQEMK